MHLLLKSESIGPQLVTYHNIAYMMSLTRSMRSAIIDGTCVHHRSSSCDHLPCFDVFLRRYPDFVRSYLSVMFPKGDVPLWVVDALGDAGIDVASTLVASAAEKT